MKLKFWVLSLAAVLCFPALASGASIEQILASMSTSDKICQLLIPAYRKTASNDATVLSSDAAALISQYPFGGFIVYGENLVDNDAGVRFIHDVQRANISADTGRPQLLVMTDQEGGLVYRLTHGTSGISPMAMGAARDSTATQTIAKILGTEVSALGINCNLAPVLDVVTNPRGYIGLRGFGIDPQLVADQASSYLRGLREAGVLGAVKHFPGTGSAQENTDGANLPVVISKTLEELESCDLIPFRQVIKQGLVDIVMVCNDSFSSIETRQFTGSDGQQYALPASVSPAIINDLLRCGLGFDGLVLTDALLGTVMAAQFSAVQVLELALQAGADMMPYALDLNSVASVAAFQQALETFTARVDADQQLQGLLDTAVRRILTFKSRHELLTPYARSDSWAASQAQTVLQNVSNQAHHDLQWPVALSAVTLVENRNQALPLSGDERVAILYYYASQEASVQLALDRLVADGQLTSSQAADVLNLDVHDENLSELLTGVDTVVILSSVYYESELSPDSPSPYSDEISIVLPLLSELAGRGVKIIHASCHLPYDIGLYLGRVDAILACYLANGISLPITTPDNQPRYGVMVPALVYKLFDQRGDFSARLPVDIYTINGGQYQLDDVLLSRGWGLTLAGDVITDPVATHQSSSGGCNALSGLWLWTGILVFASSKKYHC